MTPRLRHFLRVRRQSQFAIETTTIFYFCILLLLYHFEFLSAKALTEEK